MRILLITDTHNELEIINELAVREQVDACIHCGDFGFYDEESPQRLTQRELQLRIRHSELPQSIRKKAYDMSAERAREVLREHQLLSGFIPYLTQEKTFSIPVYAVWGNHDDHKVVRALLDEERHVPNLHLLHEGNMPMLAQTGIRLLGIGGNFYLEGDGLFAQGMTGHGGTIRASWLQYARLLDQYEKLQQNAPSKGTFFVSHVSPAKSEARLIERLCLLLGIQLTLSGHMDPPMCHAYSMFTICEPQEVVGRSQEAFDELRRHWEAERENSELHEEEKQLVDASLQALDIEDLPPPTRGQRAKPGSFESHYYNAQFLNLADTPEGWAILQIEEDDITLHTRSHFRLRAF